MPRLLDRVRDKIRVKRYKRYGIHTAQTYFDWIRRFVLFHGKRHPPGVETYQQRAITAARAAKRDAELGKVAKCVKGATAPGCEP